MCEIAVPRVRVRVTVRVRVRVSGWVVGGFLAVAIMGWLVG